MAASKDDIFRNALTLPEQDRADLIGALIDSLDAEVEENVEEAWRAEIERRAQELVLKWSRARSLGSGEGTPLAHIAWLAAQFDCIRSLRMRPRRHVFGTLCVTRQWRTRFGLNWMLQ